jgi:hypothetical protein
MTQLSFDHERLDVYHLAIDYGGHSDLHGPSQPM